MLREVLANADAVAERAAELLVSELDRALAQGIQRPSVALSGGSTPRRLYELLATPAWRARIDWGRVHWFWGDERFVPWDHPDSNYAMVRRALLDPVGVDAACVHPMPTSDTTPEQAARRYEALLRAFYGAQELSPERPLWTVNLLGMGDDGHTASLFPGVAALSEQRRWVCEVLGAKPEPRLSLTYPALNSAGLALVLAVGAGKRSMLRQVSQGADVPVARLRTQGPLLWLLDEAAAGP